MSESKIFGNFPKIRIELPLEYQTIYEKHYKENRTGQTKISFLSQMMESWLHKCIAKSSSLNKKTLEIGAGTLNQLKYEKKAIYDIVEPFKLLYEQSTELSRINKIYSDISDVNYEEKYDRIISCACFEHILNLPEVIARCCLLLKNDGGGGGVCMYPFQMREEFFGNSVINLRLGWNSKGGIILIMM